MFRFLLISAMVLIQTSSTLSDSSSEEGDVKGLLKYNNGPMEDGSFTGSHFMTKECSILNLEGVTIDNYKLAYDGVGDVKTGCVLMYRGLKSSACNGTPDKTVKLGETVDMTAKDNYFGVKYVESC